MGRTVKLFGVNVPSWKAEKQGAGASTITFILRGKIISKKNNQMAIVYKKTARMWVDAQRKAGKNATWKDVDSVLSLTQTRFIGNKLYSECKRNFLPVLEEQKKIWMQRLAEKGLKFPLKKASMNLRLYFKYKHITDTVNKQQTIQDLLVEAGIIADDDYETLNPIYSASCYQKNISDNLAVIRLSFQLPKSKKKIQLTDELM